MWVLGGLSTQLDVDLVAQVDDRPPAYGHVERDVHRAGRRVLALAVAHVSLDRAERLARQLLHQFAGRTDHRLLNHVLARTHARTQPQAPI